jgi:hypothetical protein
MMRHDLHSRLKFAPALAPVVSVNNTPLVSAIIDTTTMLAVEFLILIGAVAAGAFAVTMDHSDLLAFTDAVPVPADEMLGTLAAASFAAADANSTRSIGYLGIKQFVRLTITPTGNTSAALAVAVVNQPVTRGYTG